MRVALCQIDTTVGDFDGNRHRILAAAEDALNKGAQLAVFPELSVCGYPAEDLLLRRAFLAAHDASLKQLTAELPLGIDVLVGCLEANEQLNQSVGRPLRNAVALIRDRKCRIVARKCLLPTYDVFDESRYFEPFLSPEKNIFE